MGMDMVDGALAQDIEELVLQEVLGRQTHRLDVFSPLADIESMPYLRSRGFVEWPQCLTSRRTQPATRWVVEFYDAFNP